MKAVTISIIIPVYNREKYLDRCIESIVRQTYPHLEILLIDDGSTDASLDKCREWEKRDQRIRVIAKENGGVSSARNAGIEASCGDYIGFVDSDDYVDPAMYQTLLTPFLEDGDIDLTSCGYEFIFLDNHNSSKKQADEPFKCSRKEAMMMLFIRKRDRHFKAYTCNKLYKASLIKRYAIRYDTDIRLGEDIKFNFDYMRHINSCYVTALCGYHYCLNSSSASFNAVFGFDSAEKDLMQYCLAHTNDPEIIDSILQFAIIYYRGVLYDCYHHRCPKQIAKHVSRFFRKYEKHYLHCNTVSKKERLFALCVGRAEPLYHCTQLIKGDKA